MSKKRITEYDLVMAKRSVHVGFNEQLDSLLDAAHEENEPVNEKCIKMYLELCEWYQPDAISLTPTGNIIAEFEYRDKTKRQVSLTALLLPPDIVHYVLKRNYNREHGKVSLQFLIQSILADREEVLGE